VEGRQLQNPAVLHEYLLRADKRTGHYLPADREYFDREACLEDA
jgi:hypothetical protein